MKKNIFYKFTCLLLIFGLNWFGILSVIDAFAFFNDIESSERSLMNSAILDFSVQSASDFSPQMTPSEGAMREFSVVNDGSSDINYDISILVDDSGLCRKTNVSVSRNGNVVYSGELRNFNLINLNLEISDSDNYIIESTLQDFDNSLWGKTCKFDLMFSGLQVKKIGFSDEEILENVLESGVWEDEIPVVSAGDVVINEIMWMGSKDDNDTSHSGDEWIELRNMTSHEIDIGKWEIENAKSANKTYTIPASRSIPAFGYFLIANHPEESNESDLNVIVNQPNANTSFHNNYDSNGQLVLKDNNGNIIDITPLPDSSDWPSGINEVDKKLSMERNLTPGDGNSVASWHTCDPGIMTVADLATMRSYWDADAQEYNCGTPGHVNLSKNDPTADDYDPTCVNSSTETSAANVEISGSEGENTDIDDTPADDGVSGDSNTGGDLDESDGEEKSGAEETDGGEVGENDQEASDESGEDSDTGDETSDETDGTEAGDETDDETGEDGMDNTDNNGGDIADNSSEEDSSGSDNNAEDNTGDVGKSQSDGSVEGDTTGGSDSDSAGESADTAGGETDGGSASDSGDSGSGSTAADSTDSSAGDNTTNEN